MKWNRSICMYLNNNFCKKKKVDLYCKLLKLYLYNVVKLCYSVFLEDLYVNWIDIF